MLRIRELTAEERGAIKRVAHSRTEAARAVERARIIWLARQRERVAAIADQLDITAATTRLWIKRFDQDGVAGLADRPHSGAPPTYSPAQVGEVIAVSLTSPTSLGLPFGSWTLDRLAAYLNEEKGLPIKGSRIGEILLVEGLKWRALETWFGEWVAPAFAEQRGPSTRSTRPHLRVVS